VRIHETPVCEFLPAHFVRARYGNRSRVWLHRAMKDHGFPAPVKLTGQYNFWRLSDLLAWEARQAAREQRAKRKPPVPKRRRAA
jgi:predicted DNA-binding transcriptional regulator AlpA